MSSEGQLRTELMGDKKKTGPSTSQNIVSGGDIPALAYLEGDDSSEPVSASDDFGRMSLWDASSEEGPPLSPNPPKDVLGDSP